MGKPDVDAIITAGKTAVVEGEAILRGIRMPPPPKSIAPQPPQPEEDALTIDERIAAIVRAQQQNRYVSAGLGLVNLVQWYEASDPTVFPVGQRTLPEFLTARVPLDAALIQRLVGGVLHRGGLLRCAACNTAGPCLCACGAPYVPEQAAPALPKPVAKTSALERATAAILATPEKSNRAIAAEIGVSNQTVMRARQRIKSAGSDGALMEQPDLDTGQSEAERDHIAFLLRAEAAAEWAWHPGPLNRQKKRLEVAEAAEFVIRKWNAFLNELGETHGDQIETTNEAARV